MNIERVVAFCTGKSSRIARGSYAVVYEHGRDWVYKEAILDGTAVWLERCFMIQQRLGLEHKFCEGMPEVRSIRIDHKRRRYSAVIRRYSTKWRYDAHPVHGSQPGLMWAESIAYPVIGDEANDCHDGNILLCETRGWIVTDPSCSDYGEAYSHKMDPKFMRAAAKPRQYGPVRKH
jgi:hypothetical protein